MVLSFPAFSPSLTLLLFSSFSSVTNFDCADADNDGDDEEEDASNETSCDGSSLDILRHGVPFHINQIIKMDWSVTCCLSPEWITGSVGSGGVGVHSEHVGLGRPHVLNCKQSCQSASQPGEGREEGGDINKKIRIISP